MLVYVWSRRNPNVRMNFFGLLNFQAPFLPWVLMGFSLLLGNSIIVDLLGTPPPRRPLAPWPRVDLLSPLRYRRGPRLLLPGGRVPQPAGGRPLAPDPGPHVSLLFFRFLLLFLLLLLLLFLLSSSSCSSCFSSSCSSSSPPHVCVSCRKMLFDTPEEDANYNPLPEERPGGFAWGEGQRLGG